MALDEANLEHILDRRLGDFEKLMNVKLTSIESGVTSMLSKVSNLHIDYVPRSEIEKDQAAFKEEMTDLKKTFEREIVSIKRDVKRLEAWRNTLLGAITVMAAIIGWMANAHILVK